MIEINGTKYQYALLDTNIVSEILKSPDSIGKAFIHYSLSKNIFPCISIWSILEIRKQPSLYDMFLDFFSVFSFILTKSPYDIFENELEVYPDYHLVDVVQFSFSLFNKDENAHLKKFMNDLFAKPDVLEMEKQWDDKLRQQAIKGILDLKPNFPPSGKYYTARDGTRFIQNGVLQYVISQRTSWAKEMIESSNYINVDYFPSVKMGFYTVFYRFYAENREPEEQDIFDILITNVAPYMDIVITEKFQAEIFNKVKNRDPFIKHLDILNLKSLRKYAKEM